MALVIAPTRELAMQVKRELDWLYEMTGAVLKSCVVGMDIRNVRRALERGALIVVGTPRRICDHIRRGELDLSYLRVSVLAQAAHKCTLPSRAAPHFSLTLAPDTPPHL